MKPKDAKADRLFGVDVNTRRIAIASIPLAVPDFQADRSFAAVLVEELPKDSVNRLTAAAHYARKHVTESVVVIPEWPQGASRRTSSRLERVLGAFLSGCDHAAWVHEEGVVDGTWKKHVLGHGRPKIDGMTTHDSAYFLLKPWALQTFQVDTDDEDILAALAIAQWGRDWWESQR